MKLFFTTLKFITLENIDSEIELEPGIKLTHIDKVRDLLLTDDVISTIGIIEVDHLINSSAILYYQYDDNEEFLQDLPLLKGLELILLWIDDLLKNLWLVKDNAVVIDTAYLLDIPNEIREASSARLQYIYSTSKGKLSNITFNNLEIENFVNYHEKIQNYFHSKNSNSLTFMLAKNFSRIGRALLFVKQAREARNIAYKISNYCSAFETIFSTDSNELSHKLSERIAFFLKDDFIKIETFKTIKKAYAVRSKLTHGDSLEQKIIDGISDLSEKNDLLLRFIFNKILNDDELLRIFDTQGNLIDDYFEKLIFG